VKASTGRFARPTSIGTGDSYAGSGFLPDGRAVSGDGYGDLDTWPEVPAGGCTQWRPHHLPGAKGLRSAVTLATAGDGSFAWVGQANAGYFVPSGDEDTGPPRPAPGALHALAFFGTRGHDVTLGRGASPAVAAIRGGRAAFAWLDKPAPNGFGGSGRAFPSELRIALLHGNGRLAKPQLVTGAFADPKVAFPPQVAAGADGTVAVLEAAGRYRLAVRHADGSVSQARDVGDASAITRVQVLSAGRRVYLIRQGQTTTRISRIR
ncbi:MAG: hypothetical protein JWM71_1213, partial [Solirubrobacteraceae bacterium]|nr:hypothetical protein [Solirubrobacteraceae bacterium]